MEEKKEPKNEVSDLVKANIRLDWDMFDYMESLREELSKPIEPPTILIDYFDIDGIC
ncbi:hypothetical protein J2X69_002682 [Algoriphagus sp. 4150]|nr:hypothetical protein [Algoriphagus sp. 4150]